MHADDENQISSMAGGAQLPLASESDSDPDRNSKQVTLYTVPGCPLCRDARQMLMGMGIAYVQQDVADSYPALRRMYKLTRQGLVPVVEFNGKALVRPTQDEVLNLVRN